MTRILTLLFSLLLASSAWGQTIVPGPGLPLSGGSLGTVAFQTLSNGQFLISNNVSGVNTLTVYNKNSAGFSAYTAIAPDVQFSSTAFEADGAYEHFAFGYGPGLTLQNYSGFNYLECSRFDTTNNAAIPPSRCVFQNTGGVQKTGVPYDIVLNGTTTATINAAGGSPATFPANGSTIDFEFSANLIVPGTTIVSGGGTGSIVMSNAALGSNGFVPTIIGPETYAQCNWMISSEQGYVGFYSWANGCSGAPTNPFFVLDRLQGRVGMNLGTGAFPQTDFDIVGKINVGGDSSRIDRNTYGGTYPISILDSGTQGLEWLKAGVDQFQLQWNATPSRLDFKEVNGSTFPLSLYMDGTAMVRTGGSVSDATYDYQTPAAGGTVTIPNSKYHEVIDPAATLATLTVNMPTTPIDGQYVDVRFSQIITALTVAGNGNSIKGNPTSAAVGSQFSCFFRSTNTTWYC